MGRKVELRNQKRKEVVEAIVIRQEPVHLVARIYNVPQRTIFDWLALYRAGGWGALAEGRRSGRPRKLSGDDLKWLYDVVTLGDPQQFQFAFCLWTLKTLRTLLQRELGVTLSQSSISRLLHHLGLSAQRPLYKSYRQNPEKVKEYLQQRFPEAVAKARELGAEIYFVDEAAVRSDAHRGTTWGVVGETPIVENSGGRFGLALISAVSPRGLMRFSFIAERMTSTRFIDFLTKLRRDARRPILVILDNAAYHHSRETQRFLAEQGGQIQLLALPAYSPELNPDEQVWNHLKGRLAVRPILSKEEMKRHVHSILCSIQKQVALVKSFFRLPDTKYILKALA